MSMNCKVNGDKIFLQIFYQHFLCQLMESNHPRIGYQVIYSHSRFPYGINWHKFGNRSQVDPQEAATSL